MEKGEYIWSRGKQKQEKKMRNIFGDQNYVIAVEKINGRGKRG